MSKMRIFVVLFAMGLMVLSLSPPTRAGRLDDSITGPRRQLSVVGQFNGDTMFMQPNQGISVTNGQPRQPLSGSGWVTSVSGYITLPADQHILEAQILEGHQDPVHTQVLGNLNYTPVAVTPAGIDYALSLDGPARVGHLNDFSVMVLRDQYASSSSSGEVTAMLNIVQTSN
jgi:hypothetical protein